MMKHLVLILLFASIVPADRHLNQVILAKCSESNVDPTCLKLELLRVLTLISGAKARVSLGRGIVLATEGNATVAAQAAENITVSTKTQPQLNRLLLDATQNYFRTLNLTLRVGASNLVAQARSISADMWSGRARRSVYVAIGTVVAVGFALLAALAGKALMASMLALLLSALLTIRATSGGFASSGHYLPSAAGRITAYEVYQPLSTGPAYIDHEHHHSSALTGRLNSHDPATSATSDHH